MIWLAVLLGPVWVMVSVVLWRIRGALGRAAGTNGPVDG